jgi:hypothetical protein
MMAMVTVMAAAMVMVIRVSGSDRQARQGQHQHSN